MTDHKVEWRTRQLSPFDEFTIEERAGKPATIRGYAALYYNPSDRGTEYNGDRSVERIERGAFDRALEERHDAVAVFNHNRDMVLGRVSAGTLRLSTDSRGLRYEVQLADTTTAKDLVANIRAGNVQGSSFAFKLRKDSWEHGGERSIRTIKDLDLFDVSPVVDPAYASTSVEMNGALDKALELDRLNKLAYLESIR